MSLGICWFLWGKKSSEICESSQRSRVMYAEWMPWWSWHTEWKALDTVSGWGIFEERNEKYGMKWNESIEVNQTLSARSKKAQIRAELIEDRKKKNLAGKLYIDVYVLGRSRGPSGSIQMNWRLKEKKILSQKWISYTYTVSQVFSAFFSFFILFCLSMRPLFDATFMNGWD